MDSIARRTKVDDTSKASEKIQHASSLM